MNNSSFIKKLRFLTVGLPLLFLFSCSNDLSMSFPAGPQGPAGLSAYELWVQHVKDKTIEWNINQIEVVDYYLYLKGDDGAAGQSAYQLWVEMVNSTDGLDDPHNPSQKWPTDQTSELDFWNYLSGADGKNGTTPTIGANENWYIGTTDTGVPARGQDGEDGQNGISPRIGDNGNWYIGDLDTTVPASGNSAYEIWLREVETGLLNPHADDGSNWPKDHTTLLNFWEYLRGRDGKDSETIVIDSTVVVVGMPNVIARYYQSGIHDSETYAEYINANDGSVRYTVYDEDAEVYPNAHVTVTIDGQTYEFTSDDNGDFIIGKNLLPETDPVTQSCLVEVGGEDKSTPVNMYVPVRPQVRVTFPKSDLGGTVADDMDDQNVYCQVTRSMDGGNTWEIIPAYLAYDPVTIQLYEVSVTGTQVDFTYNDAALLEQIDDVDNLYELSSNFADTRLTHFDRPVKQYSVFVIPPGRIWDEQPHYYALSVDQLYGERVVTDNIFQVAPIQHAPMVTSLAIESESYENTLAAWSINGVTGTYLTDDIDVNLFFRPALILDQSSFDVPCYIPEVDTNIATNVNAELFRMYTYRSFTSGQASSNYSDWGNLSDPTFYMPLIYEGGSFYCVGSLYFFSTYFYRPTRTDTNTWLFTLNYRIGSVSDTQYQTITVTIP